MEFEKKSHTSKTVGAQQIRLYKYRSINIRLTWCKAVLNIIKNFDVKKVNDLGCNYFQLFKEIHLRKLKYNYYGYDHDKVFIKIGLNYLVKLKSFKKYKNNFLQANNQKPRQSFNLGGGLKFNYEIGNVEKIKLRPCDCSVLSAILEHSNFPYKILKNVFSTTRKIIILRTFVDTKEQNATQVKNVNTPYNVRKFAFKRLKKIFLKNGFDLNFILDEATQFSKKVFFVNNNTKHQRKFYIGFAIKN